MNKCEEVSDVGNGFLVDVTMSNLGRQNATVYNLQQMMWSSQVVTVLPPC